MPEITRETLRDYLNDALPDAELAAVEKSLRENPDVRKLFDSVRQESDRGEHSVGAVWRRDRLSCPSRDQLGGYLLGAGDPELIDYIGFHIKTIGCAFCQANLEDLERVQADAVEPQTRTRRRRIVDSATGILPEKRK